MNDALVERLAHLCGIGEAYHDQQGRLVHFSLQTKMALLRAMGHRLDSDQAVTSELSACESAPWLRRLPPSIFCDTSGVCVDLSLTAAELGESLLWRITLEDGSGCSGSISTLDFKELDRAEIAGRWMTRRRMWLAQVMPQGWHRLEVRIGAGPPESTPLIVAPQNCYEPASIIAGARVWGLAVQLYTLRSRANWGMGDFADLHALIHLVAARGGGFVGLNPLHALSVADPARASPYSASNRHFLNVLYVAIPAVPEFASCDTARRRTAEPDFQQRLAELRAALHVDYRGVAAAKFEIFELLFAHFQEIHLARGSPRAASFRQFVVSGGERLRQHALFDALDTHFRAEANTDSGWLSWPEAFRDPASAAVAKFLAEHSLRVDFFLYLQWLANEQLLSAQALTRQLEMPIGLYGDYAVGANPAGSEVWTDRQLYCLGAEIGAPPDALALKGQGWGVPPQKPAALTAQGLEPFRRLIASSARYYGALRLDHVMALFRQWWVPQGLTPGDGAYVHYPLQEQLRVLALVSQQHRCLIVGEDLGVVPQEIHQALPQFAVYHYKVLLFEKDAAGFRRPDQYTPRALATPSTHDMPTLRGYFGRHDLALRDRLHLYPTAEIKSQLEDERSADIVALHRAFVAERLISGQSSPELARAAALYLARSRANLIALQAEDLVGTLEPVNVPGTSVEYPNWSRKLDRDLEELFTSADAQGLWADVTEARQGG
jgi:4-alpha-glucanotransferase